MLASQCNDKEFHLHESDHAQDEGIRTVIKIIVVRVFCVFCVGFFGRRGCGQCLDMILWRDILRYICARAKKRDKNMYGRINKRTGRREAWM